VYHEKSESLFNQLAQQGILVRYLPKTSKTLAGLRFGLLGNNEEHWQRLDKALSQLKF
jgi:histidinol-phosphate/aromatic aminotransferase/cobyric acid decarboxylase-like protein